MIFYRATVCIAILSLLAAVRSQAFADTPENQQPLNQQQQNEARQESLATQSKSLLSSTSNKPEEGLNLPQEAPCYPVNAIEFENKNAVAHWMTFQDVMRSVRGKCVGINGLKMIHKAVQNRLIEHGYITTRVLIPAQDLKSGTLKFQILPGTISDIVFKGDGGEYIHAINNFPEREGDVLDLRGLEQGLENLQRTPGSEATINLVPGAKPGETRVEVMRTQPKHWRLGAWADDSGSKYTGRYQSGLALYLDNLTSFNDMFYIAYGGGLKNEDGRRSDNVSAFYSVPWGYWQLELYGSKYRYTQTIHDSVSRYLYSGIEKYLSAQLSRVIYRSASQKTTLAIKAFRRHSTYLLNDVEIEVQRRKTSNWKLSLEHLAYLPFGQIKGSLGYQKAAHWFNEQEDAEEMVGNADAQARIITLGVDGAFPFRFGDVAMSYEPHFMSQTSPDRLTQPDKFTIGNRWTVRGFDGETTIYADKGWYLRNDINLNLPQWGMQPYLGVDYGEVKGSKNDYWSGKQLAGTALGVRGVKGQFGYDLFAGVPLMKPQDLHTSPFTLGFAVQWQY
ncbi:ShlB/FhaC/HecB family hemolysin secretion/activation protein [Cronobacter sakazakii]|uniref:ShlB/FhaC/HecB family hemolysin secretion/activation protein n=1 Tax=Cronobacter sakazakii TaxID=28141 RepID=UPI000D705065|nr:ShlB/FhaC/HecB family hemolysin secretion/activation protein [Cronobacter sakazakii]EIV2970827.1 ShlB/FhaC/HecB family hemolysin secretion/activation protein [Cronobacter sakazakii]MBR9956326.1 ShlB/FhaC/HecB family hemolysin secretion/activation protein [Cronobacter sakazakii]PWV24161.1 ShlB/FhaC/HecB family hemolysin secretion/activation protein [Cronobacter sakazakii]